MEFAMIDERPSPQFEQFCEDVRLGMEQLERGEFNEYDEAGLRERFEQLKRRAIARIDGSACEESV
jgi:hypothetical protein